jgi:archaemetzincin
MRRIGRIVSAAAVLGLAAYAWVAVSPSAEPSNPAPRSLMPAEQSALPRTLQALLPLHQPLAAPQPGEWLDRHREAGQNYQEYLASDPVRARPTRRTIYVQPLGDFTPDERRVVRLASEFLGHAFQLPVRVREDLPLSVIAAEARRNHPQWGTPQILSTFVLDRVLKPRLPDDAATYIALTASDLWPGEGWNFVFGQASLGDRVGVWSIHRFGDPGAGEDAFRLALLRTLKTSIHETGHMFSLQHCVHFACVMNGSNHLQESDAHPAAFCPQCLAKLAHATGADPGRHLAACAEFARANGLQNEYDFWRRSIEALDAGERR